MTPLSDVVCIVDIAIISCRNVMFCGLPFYLLMVSFDENNCFIFLKCSLFSFKGSTLYVLFKSLLLLKVHPEVSHNVLKFLLFNLSHLVVCLK